MSDRVVRSFGITVEEFGDITFSTMPYDDNSDIRLRIAEGDIETANWTLSLSEAQALAEALSDAVLLVERGR